MGKEYFSKPYKEVLAKIPKEHQTLGVACIDCHNNRGTKKLMFKPQHEFKDPFAEK